MLDGAATPNQIISAQKDHFIELGGFSQHFAAAYVCTGLIEPELNLSLCRVLAMLKASSFPMLLLATPLSFSCRYKAKRLERHMSIKNNRETMRVGTAFIAACFGLDLAIYVA